MEINNQCTAWIDKAALLRWLEYRAYYDVMGRNEISAFDAYRDVIAYVSQMPTRITNLPEMGLR